MLAGLGPENQPPLRFSFPVVGNGKFAKTSWATFCDPETSRRAEQVSSIRPNDYSWWNVRRISECTWLNRFRTEYANVNKLVGSVGGDSPLTRRVIVEVMFELTINERFKLSFRKGLARLQC